MTGQDPPKPAAESASEASREPGERPPERREPPEPASESSREPLEPASEQGRGPSEPGPEPSRGRPESGPESSGGPVEPALEPSREPVGPRTPATQEAAATSKTLKPDGAESLRYSLLGPSLTKAGQDSVDQRRVSEVIYNASKGSKFFAREEARDRQLTAKIESLRKRRALLESEDPAAVARLEHHRRAADRLLEELELSERDLTQHIVHLDCDAFYAAVEQLDRPELADLPFAVGGGVLTTCNYVARRFGCRSGMAGFVAKKLCPQLILLPLNFDKYTAKAREVREILAEYDPRFESASIDEAYLNLTPYCKEHSVTPEEAVSQLRREVRERTGVTVSAGIAANARLAKICSNVNKPDGQFSLPNTRKDILAFIRDLPLRKVNGVGRVFERELAEVLGIRTCGDVFPHRALIAPLFGDKAWEFLARCMLGLGRTEIRPAEEYERKSVGTEHTFSEMSDPAQLRERLRRTAAELEEDLAKAEVKGRTLVLKVKLHTFEVFTRQVVAPRGPLYKADDIYALAEPMLARLEHEMGGSLRLRLMGLRCTHLVSTRRPDARAFFGLAPLHETDVDAKVKVDADGWQIWPEDMLDGGYDIDGAGEGSGGDEGAAAFNNDADFDERRRSSTTPEAKANTGLSMATDAASQQPPTQPSRRHGKEIQPNPKPVRRTQPTRGGSPLARGEGWRSTSTDGALSEQERLPDEAEEDRRWPCPVCGRPQPADERLLNEHIDLCLSRQAILESVRGEDHGESKGDTVGSGRGDHREAKNGTAGGGAGEKGLAVRRKRGRPPAAASVGGSVDGAGGDKRQRKLTFGLV